MLRRQLAAYSPLSLGGIAKATLDATRGADVLQALERHLASRFGAGLVVLTGSGTQALQLALEVHAMNSPASSHVALPAYSCYDLVSAAVGADVAVSFYDVVPASLTPDLDDLADCVHAGASTVVVGNLFGFPVDWDAVRQICAASGAMLVEDAAQGLGSTWRGIEGGSFGDMTVLSFGRGKGWTGGGGGALLVRGRLEALVRERISGRPPMPGVAAVSRTIALCLAQWLLGRPRLYEVAHALPGAGLGETRYKAPMPVASMLLFSAALLLRGRDEALREIAIRRRNATDWIQALALQPSNRDSLDVCRPTEGEAGYLRLPLLAESREAVADILRHLPRCGVAPGYPSPLDTLPQLAKRSPSGQGTLVGARQLTARLFTLPTHRLVHSEDVRRVARAILDVLDARATTVGNRRVHT